MKPSSHTVLRALQKRADLYFDVVLRMQDRDDVHLLSPWKAVTTATAGGKQTRWVREYYFSHERPKLTAASVFGDERGVVVLVAGVGKEQGVQDMESGKVLADRLMVESGKYIVPQSEWGGE